MPLLVQKATEQLEPACRPRMAVRLTFTVPNLVVEHICLLKVKKALGREVVARIRVILGVVIMAPRQLKTLLVPRARGPLRHNWLLLPLLEGTVGPLTEEQWLLF